MAKFNGTEFKLHDSTVEFDEQSELEITVEADTIDVTSKDSAGREESAYGLRRWSGSATLIVDFQETTKKGYKELVDYITNRTVISMVAEKTTEATGDISLSGDMLVTSVGLSVPMEDKVVVSFSFKGTGALTQASAT